MALKGSTEPRLFTPPLRELTPETSLGFEAIAFAEEILGITLRPWQEWLLIHALEILPDGSYRFDRIVVLVARQNGKTTLMVVLALWRIFMDGAARVVSTAQNLGVAEESLVDGFRIAARTPELADMLPDKPGEPNPFDPDCGKWMSKKNGAYRMELSRVPEGLEDVLDISGGLPSWSVTTASRTGGRSISADLALLDELREHYDWDAWEAITPTTIERPRSQVWAFSNAGDHRSVVLRELRDGAVRSIKTQRTDTARMGLFEWSAEPGASIHDPEAWAAANPSLGYGNRSESTMAGIAASEPENGFRTEYLCQWVEVLEPGKIDPSDWQVCRDPESQPDPASRISVGVEVSADSKAAHIAIYAERPDGLGHAEIIASRAGVHWVAGWLKERLDDPENDWFDGRVACQSRGAPVSAIVGDLEAVGLEVVGWEGPHLVRACGATYNAITGHQLRHRGQPVLDSAAEGAKDRKLSDAWIWDRHNSAGDVTPIVAVTAAQWLHDQPLPEEKVSAYDDGAPVMFI